MRAAGPLTHPFSVADYRPDSDSYDEALDPAGTPRPLYGPCLDALRAADLEAASGEIAGALAVEDCRFDSGDGATPFRVDPVPRLLTGEEWSALAAGLEQRLRGLEAFVADVYGARRIVAAGVVPARVIDSCDHLEPELMGIPVAGGTRIGVAGLDVVRGEDGCFAVLEDNLRTPSGFTYLLAARAALDAHGAVPAPPGRRSLDAGLELLERTLRAAAPAGVEDPQIVLLSDGSANSARYEHEAVAARLDLPLVGLADLERAGGRLFRRAGRDRVPVDVVYRRTDEDRLADAAGRPTEVGALLLEPIKRGTLACVNAFGTGVADDKLVHAYVEDMVRFYLGEEPLLPSVQTYDLEDEDCRLEVLDRLSELVLKPRVGHGGRGIVIGPHARREDREAVGAAIRAEPRRWVAQETIALSTHPTVVGDRLEPRHVDLRPFVFRTGDEALVLPGGLTRVAFGRGALVVNSSQNGGGKDTWVIG